MVKSSVDFSNTSRSSSLATTQELIVTKFGRGGVAIPYDPPPVSTRESGTMAPEISPPQGTTIAPKSLQFGATCTLKEYIDCFASFQFESYTWVPNESLLFNMSPCRGDRNHRCPETFPLIPAPLCHCRLQNIWQNQLQQDAPAFKKLSQMKVAFVGDSTVNQVASHFQCAASAIGLSIRSHMFLAHTYERLKSRNVVKQLQQNTYDVLVFGFGLWYNARGEKKNRHAKGHDDIKYRSDMAQFAAVISQTFKKPRLIWLEHGVQHYPGGLYKEGMETFASCLPTSATEYPRASWRVRRADPIVEKYGFSVVRSFNLSFPMWREHPFLNRTVMAGQNARDCTHYCQNGPTLMQTVTLLLAKFALE